MFSTTRLMNVVTAHFVLLYVCSGVFACSLMLLIVVIVASDLEVALESVEDDGLLSVVDPLHL